MNGTNGVHAVLVTGVTGLVGGDLLPRLLERRPGARVYCLMRARGTRPVEQRLEEVLDRSGVAREDRGRVIALGGALEKPDLGLGAARADLAQELDEIFHLAANTKFTLELEEARQVNCEGARNLLALARDAEHAGGLRRLHHVSTAYVVGGRPGVIHEYDAEHPAPFRNAYEQTKWEAEGQLAAARNELPLTCYRPSIIVGDSRTGRSRHFRVLYEPIRWLYSGKTHVLPCRPETRLDVVPVDYVCDAVLALGELEDSIGGTYHLTAGPERVMSVGEMAQRAVAELNRYQAETGGPRIPTPQLVSPDQGQDETSGERAALFALGEKVMRTHLPYMITEQIFDPSRTRAALAASGVECPPLSDYFERLVRYGVERNFRA